ncbi:MAG: orotidine-5'-phosphate decarboxylase [Chloroflexota bacterium]
MSFLKQLDHRAQTANSLLCVGLDPHPELLSENTAEAARDLCFHLIDATADLALAFKPNSAFFEAFGSSGIEALRNVIAHVPEGIPVILDAKRGDIASSSEAYARSAFDVLGATAITVSPYMGRDSVQPFLQDPTHGVFVLCKTSNPDADEFQNVLLNEPDSSPLYRQVAINAQSWTTNDNLGLVVGATDIAALALVRSAVPTAWFLVPGIGTQGGELAAALHAGLREDGLGMVINASRSIARAADPHAEAMRLRDAINEGRAAVLAARKQHMTLPLKKDQAALYQLAQVLASTGCVRFGEFTLKSGSISPIYLDMRRLVSNPQALWVVGQALARLLEPLQFDHIAGIPYAALPISTAAALISRKSLIYPRREAKAYGTKASVEGVFQAGDTAVIVDDLATTGETKFEVINRLQEARLVIRDIVVVVDREQGAEALLNQAGYKFHAVAKLRDLLDVWQTLGIISAAQHNEIASYLAEQSR